MKRCYGDFAKRLYFTFVYASAAIGIGILLDACATSTPAHRSTEQLPAGFLHISFSTFLPLEIALPKNLRSITC